MDTVIALLLAGFLIWFWIDTLRARERALRICKIACRQTNTQLLDQTVALKALGLGRHDGRTLAIRRRYRFDFSTDGSSRFQGTVVLLGPVVESVQLDMPDGAVILHAGGGG